MDILQTLKSMVPQKMSGADVSISTTYFSQASGTLLLATGKVWSMNMKVDEATKIKME
jgi:hypothetical protein